MCSFPAAGGARKERTLSEAGAESTWTGTRVLWSMPADIRSRNLFYGPGGREHQPEANSTFTFVEEDLEGTNPKFSVRDRDGVKWKVKLGEEARPETVASRLVWAAGYFTDQDYFLPYIKVLKMARLQRGRRYVEPDGSIRNVRLKREDYQTRGEWAWREDPFTGSREWNGLRVMMALINNWDLKDENNAIYDEKRPGLPDERVYMVSDLGASFGTAWLDRTPTKSKGNLYWYARTRFLKSVHQD